MSVALPDLMCQKGKLPCLGYEAFFGSDLFLELPFSLVLVDLWYHLQAADKCRLMLM